MPRAALLIGVSQSGDLPKLQAVEDGIDAMKAWAYGQEDMEQVVAVTDADEPVTIRRLTMVIRDIVESGPPEQLVVYFAGHGMSKSTEEYWLLSDAPEMVGEAIDLRASSELARRAGIPHVVFISDACRTAPEGIKAQAVTGTALFTNIDVFGRTWIDRYFATAVGDPALEIKDKESSAGRYSSLYTSVLARALMGDPSSLLTPVEGKREGELLSWTLSENLPELVQGELERRNLDLKLTQAPIARIESGEVGVISRVKVKRSASLHASPRTSTSLDAVRQHLLRSVRPKSDWWPRPGTSVRVSALRITRPVRGSRSAAETRSTTYTSKTEQSTGGPTAPPPRFPARSTA